MDEIIEFLSHGLPQDYNLYDKLESKTMEISSNVDMIN